MISSDAEFLATYDRDVARTRNTALNRDQTLTNCALGVASEIFELSEALFIQSVDRCIVWSNDGTRPDDSDRWHNLREELGDICWYCTVLKSQFCERGHHDVLLFRLDLKELDKDATGIFAEMARSASAITTKVKHVVFHGHDESVAAGQIVEAINALLVSVSDLGARYGMTLRSIMTHNVDKLRRRYPDGFSAEASINRTA